MPLKLSFSYKMQCSGWQRTCWGHLEEKSLRDQAWGAGTDLAAFAWILQGLPILTLRVVWLRHQKTSSFQSLTKTFSIITFTEKKKKKSSAEMSSNFYVLVNNPFDTLKFKTLTGGPEIWRMSCHRAFASSCSSKCKGSPGSRERVPGISISRHLWNHLYSACKDTII